MQAQIADTVEPRLPVDTNYYYYQYDTQPRYVPVATTPKPKTKALISLDSQSQSVVMGAMAIQPHIPTTVEPDRSRNIGEIPIQESVSSTGALNYTIPVQVVTGRPTLPVALNLVYSSQGGSGYMGFGWTLSGLSMINEVSYNVYYNSKTEPLKLSKSGLFVLDGMKLIKLSENVSQITYQSEQGNVKVTAYLNGNFIKYFNVYYPNGNTAVYGYETNTVQQVYYPLTKLQDMMHP